MPLLCPQLSQIEGITHGFFTRTGGVSAGLYASLNCGFGSGDDLEIVAQNRARVAEKLGHSADALCTAYQIHSAKAVTLDKPWAWRDAPEADALVTKTPGIVLGILTADCVPVLFADGKRGVIGAAHAGWKGAIGGVIEATIDAMTDLGGQKADISATIGPCIAQTSYEVGAEFHQRFLEESEENTNYFIPSARPEHFLFDLPAYVEWCLKRTGVMHINRLAHDTCLEENDFFSYRRSCLRGEPVYGRHISAIALKS